MSEYEENNPGPGEYETDSLSEVEVESVLEEDPDCGRGSVEYHTSSKIVALVEDEIDEKPIEYAKVLEKIKPRLPARLVHKLTINGRSVTVTVMAATKELAEKKLQEKIMKITGRKTA